MLSLEIGAGVLENCLVCGSGGEKKDEKKDPPPPPGGAVPSGSLTAQLDIDICSVANDYLLKKVPGDKNLRDKLDLEAGVILLDMKKNKKISKLYEKPDENSIKNFIDIVFENLSKQKKKGEIKKIENVIEEKIIKEEKIFKI